MNIPDGFAQIAPYVFATNAGAYMDHLAAALGGNVTDRSTRPDGKIANGHIRFGEASIMISEAGRGFPPSQSTFYLYVENADAAMKHALEHGMEKIMEVADMPYGDRQGGAKDIAGNIWWLSQHLTDAPYQ